jgi:hypothetical protein
MYRLKHFAIVFMGLLTLTAATTIARAQKPAATPEPADLQVLKFSWSKERVGWERDPFSGPIENFDEMRVRTRNEKRILDAKRGGSTVEANKAERDALTDQALISTLHKAPRARYGFVYKVLLLNSGAKQITAIDWDYVFFDLSTEAELGRRQFTSEQKLSPGKTREFRFFIPTPPTQMISVQALEKNERNGLGERIEVVRIDFADGTSWQRQ